MRRHHQVVPAPAGPLRQSASSARVLSTPPDLLSPRSKLPNREFQLAAPRSVPMTAAATISLCGSRCLGPSPRPQSRILVERTRCRRSGARRLVVLAATEGSAKSSGEADEQVPSWARPGSDEPPPWARNEGGTVPGGSQEASGVQVPFYAYLLASAVTAIAAIGSIFEYTNQRPAFGVVGTDSPLYAPILGFFAITGIPTSAYLWFKAVQTANKDAEEQDRKDGFL